MDHLECWSLGADLIADPEPLDVRVHLLLANHTGFTLPCDAFGLELGFGASLTIVADTASLTNRHNVYRICM